MLIDNLKEDLKDIDDIKYKDIIISNNKITLIYSEVLSSGSNINDFILKNTSYLIDKNIEIDNIYNFFYNSLPSHNIKETTSYKDILDSIFNGFVIFIHNDKSFKIEQRASLDRGINQSDTEIAIRGSKDSFNENFNTNAGLIRRRLRTNNLKNKVIFLGKESKTKIGLFYMSTIVDMSLVNDVYNKIKDIDIDGIIDSGYIKNIINSETLVFPTVITTERPDLVSMALLEGKVVLLVDNSPYAIIMPAFLIDFFHTPDDYYQKNFNISFIRIIRLIAFIISIFLPAYYIAITTHNQDSLSLSLLLNFIEQRQNVPFPSLVEALLMTISFEVLRESDMRSSSTIGSAVSILGGLILGDALVSAGIISPIMIIIVAISIISGLTFTSIELNASIRFLRILFMIFASILGIYGLLLGLIYLLVKLVSIKSFNYPYMSPFSPLIKDELSDSIIKYPTHPFRKRNPLLTKNIIRGKNQ